MQSPVKIWRNQKYITRLLGREGKIVSFTVVRVPPSEFSELAPYPVVVVALRGGERVTAQLVDWDAGNLVIGKKVKIILRRIREPSTEGIIPYGVKALPL